VKSSKDIVVPLLLAFANAFPISYILISLRFVGGRDDELKLVSSKTRLLVLLISLPFVLLLRRSSK